MNERSTTTKRLRRSFSDYFSKLHTATGSSREPATTPHLDFDDEGHNPRPSKRRSVNDLRVAAETYDIRHAKPTFALPKKSSKLFSGLRTPTLPAAPIMKDQTENDQVTEPELSSGHADGFAKSAAGAHQRRHRAKALRSLEGFTINSDQAEGGRPVRDLGKRRSFANILDWGKHRPQEKEEGTEASPSTPRLPFNSHSKSRRSLRGSIVEDTRQSNSTQTSSGFETGARTFRTEDPVSPTTTSRPSQSSSTTPRTSTTQSRGASVRRSLSSFKPKAWSNTYSSSGSMYTEEQESHDVQNQGSPNIANPPPQASSPHLRPSNTISRRASIRQSVEDLRNTVTKRLHSGPHNIAEEPEEVQNAESRPERRISWPLGRIIDESAVTQPLLSLEDQRRVATASSASVYSRTTGDISNADIASKEDLVKQKEPSSNLKGFRYENTSRQSLPYTTQTADTGDFSTTGTGPETKINLTSTPKTHNRGNINPSSKTSLDPPSQKSPKAKQPQQISKPETNAIDHTAQSISQTYDQTSINPSSKTSSNPPSQKFPNTKRPQTISNPNANTKCNTTTTATSQTRLRTNTKPPSSPLTDSPSQKSPSTKQSQKISKAEETDRNPEDSKNTKQSTEPESPPRYDSTQVTPVRATTAITLFASSSSDSSISVLDGDNDDNDNDDNTQNFVSLELDSSSRSSPLPPNSRQEDFKNKNSRGLLNPFTYRTPSQSEQLAIEGRRCRIVWDAEKRLKDRGVGRRDFFTGRVCMGRVSDRKRREKERGNVALESRK